MTNSVRRLSAVAFALVFPTAVTWCYFVAMSRQPAEIQQVSYALGKVVQFGFPLLWVWWAGHKLFVAPRFSPRGIGLGAVFGAFIAIVIGMLYVGWLKQSESFAPALLAVRAKVAGLGVDSPLKYLAMSAFYAIAHSGMEEYYWRWFVFGLLRRPIARPAFGLRAPDRPGDERVPNATLPLLPAIVISSLGFVAHHVLVLGTFLGYENPLTYLFSISVAIGGAVWAWLYEKTGTLYGAWLSHLLIDAAIFAVGFDIVRGA